MKPKIMILLGSISDFDIAKNAIDLLESLGIPYDVNVASAHRTHDKLKNIVLKSTEMGVNVFLGIAGLSAHLSGMIAANTHLPVVGVPVDAKLGGLDALFASVQMPFGAPVATVGIDRGENGAFLASQIIGIHDEKIRETVLSKRYELSKKLQKDEKNLLGKFEGKYHFPQSFDIQNNPKNEVSQKFRQNKSMKLNSPDVVIIVGSYSDMKVAKKTINFLDKMKISYDCTVISPVRYPEKFEKYLESKKDAKLFIAITGMSAHVAGAIAAHTEKPVIGVPCSIQLQGIDALLSMVDMPPGVPVATVGIDNGGNAAILAVEMLGIGNERILKNFMKFKSHINFKS